MCDKLGFNLQRFKELMDNSGMSRQEIAGKFGCDTSTVTKHYNGDRGITTDQLIKYAKLFNVSTDYLLGLSSAPSADQDISFICNYTGLSLAAVEVLHDSAYPLNFKTFSDKLDTVDFDCAITESAEIKQYMSNMGFESVGEFKTKTKEMLKLTIDSSVDSSKDFIFLLNKFIESPNGERFEIMDLLTRYIKATAQYDFHPDSKEFSEFQLFLISKKLGDFANSIANEYLEIKSKDNEAQEYQNEQARFVKNMKIMQTLLSLNEDGDTNGNH